MQSRNAAAEPALRFCLFAAQPDLSLPVSRKAGRSSMQAHLVETSQAFSSNTFLRNYAQCPEGLLHYWIGHADTSMTDRYDKIKDDTAFRLEWAKKCGIGFDPGLVVPSVPKNGVKNAALKAA